MAFWNKLPFWKGVSDLTILIFLIGFFTDTIGQEFYRLAPILLLPGLVVTVIFLVRTIRGK